MGVKAWRRAEGAACVWSRHWRLKIGLACTVTRNADCELCLRCRAALHHCLLAHLVARLQHLMYLLIQQ